MKVCPDDTSSDCSMEQEHGCLTSDTLACSHRAVTFIYSQKHISPDHIVICRILPGESTVQNQPTGLYVCSPYSTIAALYGLGISATGHMEGSGRRPVFPAEIPMFNPWYLQVNLGKTSVLNPG